MMRLNGIMAAMLAAGMVGVGMVSRYDIENEMSPDELRHRRPALRVLIEPKRNATEPHKHSREIARRLRQEAARLAKASAS